MFTFCLLQFNRLHHSILINCIHAFFCWHLTLCVLCARFLCVWIGIRYKRENECFTKSISLQCKNDTFIISKQLWIYIIFHIASWFFFSFSRLCSFRKVGVEYFQFVYVEKKILDALFSSMNAVEWWCFFLCIDALIPGYLIYNKLHYLFCSIKIMLSIFFLSGVCGACIHIASN